MHACKPMLVYEKDIHILLFDITHDFIFRRSLAQWRFDYVGCNEREAKQRRE